MGFQILNIYLYFYIFCILISVCLLTLLCWLFFGVACDWLAKKIDDHMFRKYGIIWDESGKGNYVKPKEEPNESN